MRTEKSLLTVVVDHHDESAPMEDEEAIDFDRLVHLVEDDGLIRLGLKLMERVAQAEGRALWH